MRYVYGDNSKNVNYVNVFYFKGGQLFDVKAVATFFNLFPSLNFEVIKKIGGNNQG